MSINILCQNIRGLNVQEKVEKLEEQAKILQIQIMLLQEHMLINDKKYHSKIML